MRSLIVYWLLRAVSALSRTFYTPRWEWVGSEPHPWPDYRLVAVLNHTSLYEFLFAALVPRHFLQRMARHGVVPIASKTIDRPLVGRFWRFIAGNVVSISRERDETWEQVLRSIAPDSMIIILPEGRMKRANGLDAFGRPLTIRGGIADLLSLLPDGKLLLAYSLGLHHIQVPGQTFPKLWKPIEMRFEQLDIAAYRAELLARCARPEDFRQVVIDDFTDRRDRYCTLPLGSAGTASAGTASAGTASAG